ncbi:hypothetical protein F5Y15DRAFT_395504 [Xylariaceae sp. FL0016]|nr:hypothetical protein F5Y15DRAFT_395504 [Xylariaceae sp. FL0016]
MADLGSWLRIGARSRTPNSPAAPTAPWSSPSSDKAHQARDSQAADSRRNVISRTSSYPPSVASLSSFPSEEPQSGTNAGDGDAQFYREEDQTWHNPSLHQMAEALRCQIMVNGIMKPLPVEYNTYVLHLIEGFANAEEKARCAERAKMEFKESLEQNLDQCRQLTEDWIDLQDKYKTEIKRLEVLLSKTAPEGLEAVTLARKHSVVNRSGPGAKSFLTRVNELRGRHTEGMYLLSSPSCDTLPTTFPDMLLQR